MVRSTWFVLGFAAALGAVGCGGDTNNGNDGGGNDSGGNDGGGVDAPSGNAALTVTPAGNGAGVVTSQPSGINCGPTCTASFPAGSSIVLTATPSTGSTFGGWSGGGCSGTGNCTVSLSAATTVTATFTLQQYVMTVTTSGSGTVSSTPTGIDCGNTCAFPFDYGTNVTLTATPSPGATGFAGWSGAGCNGLGTCVVNMTAAASVTAAFKALATWDPTWSLAGVTYTNNNLTISGNSSGTKDVRTTIGKSSGQVYWEITATTGAATDQGGLGIAESAMPNNAPWIGNGASGLSFGYYGYAQWWLTWSGVTTPNGDPPASSYVTTGTVYMFALDMDKGNFWVGQNGTWYNGGDPNTTTAPAAIGITGTVYPAVTLYNNSTLVFTANFGGSAFKYTVPTGYQPGFF